VKLKAVKLSSADKGKGSEEEVIGSQHGFTPFRLVPEARRRGPPQRTQPASSDAGSGRFVGIPQCADEDR
jgi:hypothetical protein